MTSRRLAIGFILSALATSTSAGAYAQVTDETSLAGDVATKEIVVTARKREETLRSIPASVSAVTANVLDDRGIQGLEQISELVPGLTFTLVGSQSPMIGIRGNVNRSGIPGGSDVPVSVFLDGVYIPRNTQISYDPLDVERVEVLKGPQGTIYGRNTIGGAINLVTAEPTHDFYGMISAGFGHSWVKNDYLWKVSGVISGPVIQDKLLVRIAAQHNYRKGYQVTEPFGYRGNNNDETMVRAKATLLLSEAVTVKLAVEHGEKDAAFVNSLLFEPGRTANAAPFIPVSQLPFTDNIYKAFSDSKPEGKSRFTRGTLNIAVETGVGTFTSLTSYARNKSKSILDGDGTSLPITFLDGNPGNLKSKDFSQELRLVGDGGGFTWLAGLFYFHETGKSLAGVNFLSRSATPGLKVVRTTGIDTTSYAAFGQLGYDITDKLNLSVGLRYSKDKKDTPFTLTSNGVVGLFRERKESWGKFDQNAVIKYSWTPDVMTYASYASGFRSGGFNDPSAPTVATVSFAPEKVRAFEVGIKSRFLDRRVTADLALFLNKYKGLQINGATADPNNVGGFIFVTTNAGNSDVKGFDLELTQRVLDGLTLKQSWSYLDGRIDKYAIPAGVNLPNPTGLRLPRAPVHTLLLGADYQTLLGPGRLTLGAQYLYMSAHPGELEPRLDPTGRRADGPLPARNIVNAQVGYAWESWKFNLSVRNLFFDKYIITTRQAGPAFFRYVSPGEPRTVIFSVRKEF